MKMRNEIQSRREYGTEIEPDKLQTTLFLSAPSPNKILIRCFSLWCN